MTEIVSGTPIVRIVQTHTSVEGGCIESVITAESLLMLIRMAQFEMTTWLTPSLAAVIL